MATLSKEDVNRLTGMYADRLTRNARYRVEDMAELVGSEVWRGASETHRDFIKAQVREGAFNLLRDAGFPPDVIRRIKERKA